MAGPYETMGVSPQATQEEIRKAYLRLAKKNHPDLHPGDKGAEARFKEITSANEIIGDKAKRVRFDSGEIDASGAERQRQPDREFYRQHADAGSAFRYDRGLDGGDAMDDDFFAELFGTRGAPRSPRGSNVSYTFSVAFIEAINGARKRVVMADGKALDIVIPAGLQDGQTLRLRGEGRPGNAGGKPGDALLEIHIAPHLSFQRDGNNIRSKLALTLGEALAGTRLPVETVSGTVQLTIPKGSNSGSILRLRGKGVPAASGHGDHLVELRIVLPPDAGAALLRCVTEWEAGHPYNPRETEGRAP